VKAKLSGEANHFQKRSVIRGTAMGISLLAYQCSTTTKNSAADVNDFNVLESPDDRKTQKSVELRRKSHDKLLKAIIMPKENVSP